jgi:hypothetical protein
MSGSRSRVRIDAGALLVYLTDNRKSVGWWGWIAIRSAGRPMELIMSRRLALTTLLVLGSLLVVVVAADPSPPFLPPTRITLKQADSTLSEVAAQLTRSSGLTITANSDVAKKKCPTAFADTALWEALERVAHETDAKILVSEADGGRAIALARRGASKEVSATTGAFRVALRSVTGRLLLETGTAFHELQLLVHWEPRYHVFRIDSTPRVSAAKFDKSSDLITDPTVTWQYPASAMAEMKIRLAGLPHRAGKIDVVAGEFRATAAAKMITFAFNDLTAATTTEKQADRVTARLKPLSFDESTTTWDVELELKYPPGGPVFESFEEHKWLRDNRIQLVTPQGKPINADSEDVVASGSLVSANYRFKNANPRAKGWSIVYEAPAPLVEVTVPFKLENIPLP